MKSTKRILSAILSVVMILGCLAVGFTAQASAADLVDAIAKGGDVNWTGGNVTLTDTLTIKGDVTVDLNGAVITGPEGKAAVVINGNVTLYDGVIVANNEAYSGEIGFVKSLLKYKPAIKVTGGNVILDCVTAVGSLLRIPNSSSVEIPVGNGIETDAGNVTLKNVISFGMNALDNDNASSNVTVEDAILVGIYKAVNRSSRVNFGGDAYTQYKTVDFLEAFLEEGVTLSANEKKYIDSATNSEGDLSVASVLVNVATPNFNELTSVYNNGVLSVIAAEEAHEEAEVSNRYSYKYTPDVCTVNGVEKEFELVDGQYVATFTGLEENKEYVAEANYDLSVKLGKKQKEVVSGAFDMIASYAAKAPQLLYRFVKDFEDLYQKAESLVGLAWGALEDASVLGFSKQDLADLAPVKALIYALEGREYNGWDGDTDTKLDNAITEDNLYSQVKSAYAMYNDGATAAMEYYFQTTDLKEAIYYITSNINANFMTENPIFDTNGDGIDDSVFAYTYGEDFELAATFEESEFAKGTPGYGIGKGLLDVFDDHYEAIMAELYNGSTTEFNDIGAAAEYIGDNWEGILELVENAVVVLNKADAILNSNDEDSALTTLIEYVAGSSFSSYLDAFDTAVKYVNNAMDKVDEVKESSFVATYGDKAGEYCKRYALKAWDIANNPDKYFEIEVEGDYVNVDLTKDELNAEFKVNTNVEVKDVYVQVKISGYGSAEVNGVAVSANSDEIWFEYGETINVVPVAKDAGCSFAYMTVDNGSNSVVVDGDSFTTKAATNLIITVVFQQKGDSDETDFVFMTDKALNYKLLDGFTLSDDQVAAEWDFYTLTIEAPDFAKLTKLGWALDKDGTNPVALADLAEAAAEAAADEAVVIVYAIYEYDEKVQVETQDEAIKMTEWSVVDGKAYFTVSIQLGDAKAIEAGIIVTKNADLATDDTMNIKLSGVEGVAFARTSKVDADGYVNPNVLYTAGVKTTGTVYARGYVVYADGTAEYTDIVSLNV